MPPNSNGTTEQPGFDVDPYLEPADHLQAPRASGLRRLRMAAARHERTAAARQKSAFLGRLLLGRALTAKGTRKVVLAKHGRVRRGGGRSFVVRKEWSRCRRSR